MRAENISETVTAPLKACIDGPSFSPRAEVWCSLDATSGSREVNKVATKKPTTADSVGAAQGWNVEGEQRQFTRAARACSATGRLPPVVVRALNSNACVELAQLQAVLRKDLMLILFAVGRAFVFPFLLP